MPKPSSFSSPSLGEQALSSHHQILREIAEEFQPRISRGEFVPIQEIFARLIEEGYPSPTLVELLLLQDGQYLKQDTPQDPQFSCPCCGREHPEASSEDSGLCFLGKAMEALKEFDLKRQKGDL